MKKTILFTFILLFLASLVSFEQSQIYAKSDASDNKSNQGQSSSVENKGKSNQQNQGTSSQKASEKIKPGEGNNNKVNRSNQSSSQGKQDKKDKQDTNQQFSSRGRGKITILSSTEKIATRGAKLKKVDKVLVKEASVSAQANRRAVHGIISSVNGSVITLVHQIQRERTYQILVSGETIIQTKSEKSATASASLVPGIRIVAVGDLNSSGQIVAKRIHIIPGKAIGIFKKQPLATSSGTATSSAEN